MNKHMEKGSAVHLRTLLSEKLVNEENKINVSVLLDPIFFIQHFGTKRIQFR